MIYCGMCNDTGLQNGVKCPQPGCRKANGLFPFDDPGLTTEQNRRVAEAQGRLQECLRLTTDSEAEYHKLMRHALMGLLAVELEIEV